MFQFIEVLKGGLPRDLIGRFLLALWLVIGAAIYVGRVRISNDPTNPDDWDSIVWYSLCLFGFIVVFLFVMTIVYIINLCRHPLPPLLMLVCLILGLWFPLPPTPEAVWFSSHKAEYEQVVELARNNQLIPSDESRDCLPLPARYESIAETIWCLSTPEQQPKLVVEFQHYNQDRYGTYYFVYFEDPTMAQKLRGPCREAYNEGAFGRLDKHWYFCAPYY
jgi:hypothetical protein